MTPVPAGAEEARTAAAADHPCELYVDHGSAVPAVTQGHHVFPVYLQNRAHGRIVDGTLEWLCGTCHDNVHAWVYWLMGERGRPRPDPPLRARRRAEVIVARFRAVVEATPTV